MSQDLPDIIYAIDSSSGTTAVEFKCFPGNRMPGVISAQQQLYEKKMPTVIVLGGHGYGSKVDPEAARIARKLSEHFKTKLLTNRDIEESKTMATNKGVHRSTPTSKSGRRMIVIGKTHDPANLTAEQREWNARVEAKRAAKKKVIK